MSQAVRPTAVLIVIAGPAGSGKTTLCDRLVTEGVGFSRVVTTTTRPPRPGEVDGVHYHFLTPERFDELIAADAFLEWAWVHQKHRYGTLADSVREPLRAGRSLVINVDVQGVGNFRRAANRDALLARHLGTVFINVPLEILRARMVSRGQDSAEEIEHRLRMAEQELQQADSFDFQIESRSRDEDFSALQGIVGTLRQRVSASA